MFLFYWKWPALATVAGLAGLFALFALHDASADEKEPAKKVAVSKLDLTPETAPKLLALVRPQPTEWRHLKVEWLTDVIAARRLAAKENRPMVVLYTGGAGYNEPLGIC